MRKNSAPRVCLACKRQLPKAAVRCPWCNGREPSDGDKKEMVATWSTGLSQIAPASRIRHAHPARVQVHAGKPASPGPDPMCGDANSMEWAMAWMEKKKPPKGKVGFMYMLSGGTDGSNTDPYATKPEEGNNWIETGPCDDRQCHGHDGGLSGRSQA
ncbi:hypothetical protein [Mesorhizobium sp. M0047]|uniref:hypothetical protein n=1 Tax=Mesorhizobium sp. M0047 TaxID=2956859 RepID=UPI00333DE8DF